MHGHGDAAGEEGTAPVPEAGEVGAAPERFVDFLLLSALPYFDVGRGAEETAAVGFGAEDWVSGAPVEDGVIGVPVLD